ncbi:MAG: hypothetical protein IJA12_03750 [Oscillospiraceae bacterium]|nr:hypothetical protein [Oscillospiraceae bacterium]
MLKSFLRLVTTIETLQHDDWRERIKARNKVRAKILLVLSAIIVVLLVVIRFIT